MKLYSGPLSLFSRKVEVALAEKGLVYEREMVPFSQTQGYAPKHPAVLAANPKAQVPVLVDGDLALFDSTVILEYLEDAYPEPRLMPSDPKARARCRLLELTADEIFLRPLAKLMYRTEPEHRDPDRRRRQAEEAAQAERELLDIYRMVEAKLEGPYLCGAFSTADIAIFLSVLYSLRLGGPRLDAVPALRDWYDRMADRPAAATVAAEVADADRRLSRPVQMEVGMSGQGEPLPILDQRRIEARVIKPIYDEMVARLGVEAARAILGAAIEKAAIAQGKAFSEAAGGRLGIEGFAAIQKHWTANGALEIEELGRTAERFDFNVTRCRYAEMYRAMGLGEIGHLLSCNRDGTFCQGFDPRITLERTQTIMGGASHCDFRYRFDPAAGTPDPSAS